MYGSIRYRWELMPISCQPVHTVAVDIDAGVGGGDAFEQTKQEGGPGDVQRPPVTENHHGQRQKAEARHVAVGGAVGGGQGVHKAAHTRQRTGDGGADIAHLVDIDAQRVRRLRILTAGPQPQAEAGLIENDGQDDEQDDADVGSQIDLHPETSRRRSQDRSFLSMPKVDFRIMNQRSGVAGSQLQGVLVGDDTDAETAPEPEPSGSGPCRRWSGPPAG